VAVRLAMRGPYPRAAAKATLRASVAVRYDARAMHVRTAGSLLTLRSAFNSVELPHL
jgi:hypothetical protein